jgi:hypothetical protein
MTGESDCMLSMFLTLYIKYKSGAAAIFVLLQPAKHPQAALLRMVTAYVIFDSCVIVSSKNAYLLPLSAELIRACRIGTP